jgi:hypothetical protein
MEFNTNDEPLAKLKSHGDLIERYFADRIHEVILAYARFWARYIGNDGNAQALPMPNAKKDAEESRERYWQRFYTILESLAICWDIEEELIELQEIYSFKVYAKNLNQWMAFYAHLGRIHDMVKATVNELKRPDLLKPFDDYWQERNIILHGPKVPMKLVYNVLAVPSFGYSPRNWNDKMVWSQLGPADFEFIAAGVTSILRGLEPRLNRCFAELYKILPASYGWQPVVWPGASEQNDKGSLRISLSDNQSVTTYASGTGLYSGIANISGSRDA